MKLSIVFGVIAILAVIGSYHPAEANGDIELYVHLDSCDQVIYVRVPKICLLWLQFKLTLFLAIINALPHYPTCQCDPARIIAEVCLLVAGQPPCVINDCGDLLNHCNTYNNILDIQVTTAPHP